MAPRYKVTRPQWYHIVSGVIIPQGWRCFSSKYIRDEAHINTAQGYVSQLKRSIDGSYHHVSERHFHRYLDEFDYRYNTRKVDDRTRTITAIQMITGKWLMYMKLVTHVDA